jgi:hypothetical protein
VRPVGPSLSHPAVPSPPRPSPLARHVTLEFGGDLRLELRVGVPLYRHDVPEAQDEGSDLRFRQPGSATLPGLSAEPRTLHLDHRRRNHSDVGAAPKAANGLRSPRLINLDDETKRGCAVRCRPVCGDGS